MGWPAPVSALLGVSILVAALLVGRARMRRLRLAARASEQRYQDAERARRGAEAYGAHLLALSEDGILAVDAEQRIRVFNGSAERIFGYQAQEILGQPLDRLLPPRFHDVHRRHVEEFARSSDTLRAMSDRPLLVGRRKDGSDIAIEVTIAKVATEGERIFTARIRDVTRQRETERRAQHLAGIVRSSDDAIIGKALDGTITSWNLGAERLYGYAAAEVVGRHISILVPPERAEELRLTHERVLRGEALTHFETVRAHKDGSRLDVSLTISPIRDAAGRLAGFSAIARDITERKRLEAQLRQAQKMEAIGALAGGIAHDFNNVLGVITANAELLLGTLPAESPHGGLAHEIVAAGARATALIRQILTFTRRTQQQRRSVVLQDVVAETLRLLRASLPASIEIRQQMESGRTLVLADPTQLHQVLLNLGVNAEHAMRERGGVLDVQLKTVEVDGEFAAAHPPLQRGPHLKLTIRDTGHGMTPEVRARIFDPFFTTKAPGEGTGIGLAVVHGIVADHGGVITVESAPGRGARFDVYLPSANASDDAWLDPELSEDGRARGHQEHILLVDDEASLVRVWTAVLTQMDYRVTACTDSGAALEWFQANPQAVDLVITDQTMPDMSGEALARQLLRLRPDLPIILCTGFSHTMTEEKGRSVGIRAVLMKPVARRDLCATVQRLLAEKTHSST